MRHIASILFVLLVAGNAFAAEPFQLTSPEVKEGKPLANAQVFNGMGCTGGNTAPQMHWKNAPAGTKSFALTVYDPDAPTGSGWWHWIVFDIPATASGLPAGANAKTLPTGAQQGRNDAGAHEFSGACPPPGDKPHHYVFTLYALKVDKLAVPADASAAMIGFMIHANMIGKAQLTATHSR
jgi:Raf kinase inhibitor-like YbhB/YbcL family protein